MSKTLLLLATLDTDATGRPFSFSVYTTALAFFFGTAVAGVPKIVALHFEFLDGRATGKCQLELGRHVLWDRLIHQMKFHANAGLVDKGK